MSNAFLDAARLGRNDWWRYALSVIIVLFSTLVLGALPLTVAAVLVSLDDDPATTINFANGALAGVSPVLSLVLLMLPFVTGLAALLGCVVLFHCRAPRTLITPGRPVRWRRVLLAAAVWAGLVALLAAVEALLYPGRFAFTLDLPRLLPFALAALLVVPLQTSAEELFFRGYLLQGLGLWLRQPLLLSLLSGLAFAAPHLSNPEVNAGFWPVMGFYFLFGFVLAAVTLRTQSAEVALGVHASNNLFTAVVANFAGSALETPSLFTASGFSPWYNLIGSACALLVLYALFARQSPRTIIPVAPPPAADPAPPPSGR
ncbi:MAG: CPBP family intramembrane metalloprotease [Anaerolineales bacterium]|nr:CPBP family intramembrane metalloprotease [Anaerolineales bacterium]